MNNFPQTSPKNPPSNKNFQAFRFRDLFRTQELLWLTAWTLGLLTVLATIGLLMISGWFITAAAFAGMVALGSQSFNYLVPAAIIRVMAMARTAGRYGELMVSHHAIFGLLQQLRVQFFNRLSKMPSWQRPANFRSAYAMHRLTHDIDALDEFALRLVSPWWVAVAISVAMAIGLVLIFGQLVNLRQYIWLIVGVLLIATIVIPLIMMKIGITQAFNQQEIAEQRRVSLIEPLSALTHLLLWQRWQGEIDKFLQIEQSYQSQLCHSQTIRGRAMIIMQWLMVAVIIVLLHAVGNNSISSLTQANLGVPLVLCMSFGLMGLGEVVLPLANNYLALGNSIAAKQRLNALISNISSTYVQQNITLNHLSNQPLQLKVTQLTAKHAEAIVSFAPVSFEVQTGQPLLITGSSGAGKSTLLQVLAKELLPIAGKVSINDNDLQQIDLGSDIGYLAQQIDIFDQTLAQNLRLGKPNATEDELWQVLDKVGLNEWAKAQPNGLNTPLGEYGVSISGGQARRIALARLLLLPKKILLLDEPFAGLDSDNREKLWQMLVNEQKTGILIVVTHYVWERLQDYQMIQIVENSDLP